MGSCKLDLLPVTAYDRCASISLLVKCLKGIFWSSVSMFKLNSLAAVNPEGKMSTLIKTTSEGVSFPSFIFCPQKVQSHQVKTPGNDCYCHLLNVVRMQLHRYEWCCKLPVTPVFILFVRNKIINITSLTFPVDLYTTVHVVCFHTQVIL